MTDSPQSTTGLELDKLIISIPEQPQSIAATQPEKPETPIQTPPSTRRISKLTVIMLCLGILLGMGVVYGLWGRSVLEISFLESGYAAIQVAKRVKPVPTTVLITELVNPVTIFGLESTIL